MLRVTADSNIYISALHFGGTPDRFMNKARARELELVISDDILVEVGRVLRDKFGWTKDALELAEARIQDFAEKVTPEHKAAAFHSDPADNRILDCAVAGHCDYLVTGDKHLLQLKRYEGVQIVKPGEFLDLMAKHGRGL